MDTVTSFLAAGRERLALDRYGLDDSISCVAVTPRFRASAHVVVLVLAGNDPEPVLVAKLPRLRSGAGSILREAENLRLLHEHGGDVSRLVPQVVACEEYRGWPLLLETALVGRPVDPVMVRRTPDRCCERMVDWLENLGIDGAPGADPDWFDRHANAPLRAFLDTFPVSIDEAKALERMRARLIPLADTPLPTGFEHGDLSHPNIIELAGDSVGVIDWEVADPRGLPLCDLYFFLTYVAFARAGAGTGGGHIKAFHEAFFGRDAWARPYVAAYARRTGVPDEALTPLFLLCWLRCLSRFLVRLTGPVQPGMRVSASVASWLRENRYYELWRHAVEHATELDWAESVDHAEMARPGA